MSVFYVVGLFFVIVSDFLVDFGFMGEFGVVGVRGVFGVFGIMGGVMIEIGLVIDIVMVLLLMVKCLGEIIGLFQVIFLMGFGVCFWIVMLVFIGSVGVDIGVLVLSVSFLEFVGNFGLVGYEYLSMQWVVVGIIVVVFVGLVSVFIVRNGWLCRVVVLVSVIVMDLLFWMVIVCGENVGVVYLRFVGSLVRDLESEIVLFVVKVGLVYVLFVWMVNLLVVVLFCGVVMMQLLWKVRFFRFVVLLLSFLEIVNVFIFVFFFVFELL